MSKRFIVGVVLLLLFELANVYFIMPLPYSQRVRSIELAYALHQWRWVVRLAAAGLVLAGIVPSWRAGKWRCAAVALSLLVAATVTYMANFRMSADHMFRQPQTLRMATAAANDVALDRLVVGIEVNGDARAYPLKFIGYHHQVRDKVGGEDVLVSYCTVCRTGRVYSPKVNGAIPSFRLVGMDHFNAMLEDRKTGSWWRQANGEAVAGSLRGETLAEIPSVQVTLGEWLRHHPASRVMQADSAFLDQYAHDYAYENGTARSALTGTDSASWNDKSWVVGIAVDSASKAFDWNRLRSERVINQRVGHTPVVLVLAEDGVSFHAFERPDSASTFALRGDSLVDGTKAYDLYGRGASGRLRPVKASQEFWHSWRTFQRFTERY